MKKYRAAEEPLQFGSGEFPKVCVLKAWCPRQQCAQVGIWGVRGSRGLWPHQWMDHDRFII